MTKPRVRSSNKQPATTPRNRFGVTANLISLPTPSNSDTSSPPPCPTGAVSASIPDEELWARLPRLRSSCRLILAFLWRSSKRTGNQERLQFVDLLPVTCTSCRGHRAGGGRPGLIDKYSNPTYTPLGGGFELCIDNERRVHACDRRGRCLSR